jgi:hypothetical protein
MTITLKHCTIVWTTEGCDTRFHDGTEVGACSHDVPHYYVIAHRLGYGDDLLAYTREHEFCHSFVAEKLFDQPSAVLWGVAHSAMLTGRQAAYEEFFAQGFQRFLRSNERPILSGLPKLDAWKAEALDLLSYANEAVKLAA